MDLYAQEITFCYFAKEAYKKKVKENEISIKLDKTFTPTFLADAMSKENNPKIEVALNKDDITALYIGMGMYNKGILKTPVSLRFEELLEDVLIGNLIN